MLLFPSTYVENLVVLILNHTPILIRNELVHPQQVGRRSKFENAWLHELGLREVELFKLGRVLMIKSC